MFESFGDNCEFGTIQRAHKVRNIGLFRHAWTPVDALVTLLDERFRPLRSPELLDPEINIRRPRPDARLEYVVKLKQFGIEYHAGLLDQNPDPEAYRLKELRRLTLLSRKMIEQLEGNEKIFVYKSNEPASRSQIDRLVTAMRAYGSTTLLWVTLQDELHPAGHVETCGEGLLRGYIDWFSPYSDMSRFSPYWRRICMNAYRLWQAGEE
jgi:hypothetical protein